MTRNTDILKELEQISPAVAQISEETPYQVPVGYFDTLDTVIMARIAAGGIEENSLLIVAGKQMPQDVPQGYFDTLSDSILSKIKAQQSIQTVAEELNELSPVLAGLSKENLYEVPAGYFENLSAGITEKTTETKVVSMFSRKVWVRYAAAAVLFGMIAFGITFFIQQPTNGLVADIPEIKTEEQINTELAKISDEEIINYLKMTSDSKDVAAITSFVDQSQLPAEADYMDDAFMESFMKELEQTENKSN
ncbi:MAG: hypothetical protein IPK31_04800 [Chitinophagaceae bacterium]|nr:hypothetical protein [Chitinophagaceae bacterium]